MTYKGSVTIDDMPLPLDWRHQLHDFLELRLPQEDILFARYMRGPVINPLVCDNAPDYLRSPYPPLPPIEIGEYQCPMGASRYGRALFVVDWWVLKAIANKCWGMTSVIHGDDVPLDWKISTGEIPVQTVNLKFTSNEGQSFAVAELTPLPPYRIPGSKRDLWLLPLVDDRFHFNRSLAAKEIPSESWEEFFDNLGIDTNGGELIDEKYGKPDKRLTELGQYQPEDAIIDIAALSVGLRVIFDPVESTILLQSSSDAKETRVRRMAALWVKNPKESSPTSPMIIAGGRAGAAGYPKGIVVHHKKDGEIDKTTKLFERRGISYQNLPNVWTSWEEDEDNEDEEESGGSSGAEGPTADEFCQKVADDVWGWMDAGGQYCFVGIIAPTRTIVPDDYDPESESPQPFDENVAVCGFDDYFSIQIKEHPKNPGEYVFTHRYYELPPMFLPDVLLVNGKKEACSAAIQGEILEVVEDESEEKYAIVKVTAASKCENPKELIDQEIRVYDISNEILDVEDSDSLVGEWIAAKQYVVKVEDEFKCRWLADNRGCVDEDGGE